MDRENSLETLFLVIYIISPRARSVKIYQVISFAHALSIETIQHGPKNIVLKIRYAFQTENIYAMQILKKQPEQTPHPPLPAPLYTALC